MRPAAAERDGRSRHLADRLPRGRPGRDHDRNPRSRGDIAGLVSGRAGEGSRNAAPLGSRGSLHALRLRLRATGRLTLPAPAAPTVPPSPSSHLPIAPRCRPTPAAPGGAPPRRSRPAPVVRSPARLRPGCWGLVRLTQPVLNRHATGAGASGAALPAGTAAAEDDAPVPCRSRRVRAGPEPPAPRAAAPRSPRGSS